MSVSKRFPVLYQYLDDDEKNECPRDIPWDMVAHHASQIEEEYGLSLDRLAEKGGLEPTELLAIFHGTPWRETFKTVSTLEAIRQLQKRIATFEEIEKILAAVADVFEKSVDEHGCLNCRRTS